MQRTLDSEAEFILCRQQFFDSPLADAVLPWCFPGQSRAAVEEQAQALHSTEDFQFAYVNPMLQRILAETSQGLSISGLEQLATDRKYLFISNHRCIVTDAALVSLSLLASGRGTCKVCVGDNLMATPGVSELMLLLNGVVIKRSGSLREVYAKALDAATYLAQQIEEQRYSVWLSQSPGRTKDGNDHTDPAIIKMLGLAGKRSRETFLKLHIVPVAISYEYEPCASEKVRETLLRQQHGAYQKTEGEDVRQIHASLVADKGHIHLAFGEEIQLPSSLHAPDATDVPDATDSDVVQQVVDCIDAQMERLYRNWDSNRVADAVLQDAAHGVDSAYAQAFLAKIAQQAAALGAMGLPVAAARTALLQLYARPLQNAAHKKPPV